MATRMSCPHCKASYRLSAEYNGETLRCLVCERLFRVRLLLPHDSAPYGAEHSKRAASEDDALFAESANDRETHDPTLIPFELIGPPRERPVLPEPVCEDLLPVDPPETPIQFEVIEPPLAGQPVDDIQPRSLLDSIDLSLPVESYLPAVEPERRSLLDALDLTIRKDHAENGPVLLELIEAAEGSSGAYEHSSALDLNGPVLDDATASGPVVTLELVEEPATGRQSAAEQRITNKQEHGQLATSTARDHNRNGSRPRDNRDRYERRDPRRRALSEPRRRPLPSPHSNWVSDNKGPILFIAMLLSVIVGAVVVVKLMENRTPTRSPYASEQRRPKRFEPPPEWQQNFPEPPGVQPNFQPMDPRFAGPPNDIDKPFAQPPMLEKKPITLEPKKPRKKSTLPQEPRDWVELAATAVSVDSKLGVPQIDSKPVDLAARGTTYNYLVDVRTKTSGTRALLEFGPPGMKLQNDARLVWQVPQNFPDDEADITVRVKQPDGRECSQTFVISIR